MNVSSSTIDISCNIDDLETWNVEQFVDEHIAGEDNSNDEADLSQATRVSTNKATPHHYRLDLIGDCHILSCRL